MNRIIKKILFTIKIADLGAGFNSKFIFFYEAIRIQKNLHAKNDRKPFQCWVRNNNKKFLVHFRGTVDELHALTEIFIDRCYNPKITEVTSALDLGANIGLASLWIWSEFPKCTIHAYEANPEVYKFLKLNLSQIPSTTTFNMAITEKDGTMDFYNAERSFSSSIYPVPESTVIKVPTKTLDTAISDIGNNVELVKMDIEGAEFSVAKSSKKLNNINIILGELHPEKAGEDSVEFTNILSKTHKIENLNEGKTLFYAKRM